MGPLAVAYAGFQIISGLQQAETIRSQARLNQMVADQNALYAELDAWEATKEGVGKAAQYQSVIDKTIGEQKAILAAQGVDISSGTAKQIQEETKLTGFLNQLDLEREGRMKALGLKMQASSYRLGGSMATSQAEISAHGYAMSGLIRGGAALYEGRNK